MNIDLSRKKMIAFLLVLIFITFIFSWRLEREIHNYHTNYALIGAVKRGDAVTVLAGLAQGADPNVRDIGEVTTPQIVRRFFFRLLSRRPISNYNSPPALFLAMSGECANRSVFNALFRNGADPNARINCYKWNDHMTAMILYAAADGDLESVQSLAKAGADVNARDEDGDTALNLICFWTDPQTVQLLLNKGANPNIRDVRGDLPLLGAVDGWNASVVRLLVNHNADKNIYNPNTSMNDLTLQHRLDKLLKLTGHGAAKTKPTIKKR